MLKNKNLLIISAHADDHIACAGTVFKLEKESGFNSYELIFTNSELGQDYKAKTEIDPKTVLKTRAKELNKASKFLGIKRSFSLNQSDLGLTYSKDLVFETVKIIRKLEPEIVFLHNQYDAHPDHNEAFKIGLTAIKIAAMGIKKETLGKPFRVLMVLCCEGMLPIKTQILVDISKYSNQKTKLFKIYKSQASSKAIIFEKGLAQIRGYHLRKENSLFAEAFSLQEEFPIILFEK